MTHGAGKVVVTATRQSEEGVCRQRRLVRWCRCSQEVCRRAHYRMREEVRCSIRLAVGLYEGRPGCSNVKACRVVHRLTVRLYDECSERWNI